MVFDALVFLNVIWAIVCINIVTPAFYKKNYKLVNIIAILIVAINTIFLFYWQEKTFIDAFIRSIVVSLINISVGYLVAHFGYHKKSVKDLFKKS